jgi:cellulose synthase/poly-beta-1,6-N-acetylglucosamine synthase-like glycosyltransferase
MDFGLILIVLCLIIVAKDILLIILLKFNFKLISYEESNEVELPFVSILIAVRNEEQNIQRCLEHLRLQDYPDDKYEIIVGNDRSEDHTLEILRELESIILNLIVYNIEELVQAKHGKMNVLAQLGLSSKGEILLFTDADTRVPNSWMKSMVHEIQQGNGIVTGTTLLETKSVFEKFQNIEWGHSIAMMKVVSDLNVSVSTIGNNMAISRSAYDAVGGYLEIPFSVTEDHEIFMQIDRKGYKSFHIFQESVLAASVSSSTIGFLLMQRKRWMKGAFKLTPLMLILLMLNTLYYPIVIYLLLSETALGVLLLSLKVLIQAFFIDLSFRKLKMGTNPVLLFFYELYAAFINLSAFLIYLLPIDIKWKGRKY